MEAEAASTMLNQMAETGKLDRSGYASQLHETAQAAAVFAEISKQDPRSRRSCMSGCRKSDFARQVMLHYSK